jgi:hypothetical protein
MGAEARRTAILLLLGLGILAAQASAEPANGFGAGIGLVANSYDLRHTGISSSAGGGLIGDMQFVVNEKWSLNPYFTLSGEIADQKQTYAMNGVAGFEVRHWWGDQFLGVHLAAYSALVTRPGSSSNYYDPGAGISLGTERASGFGYVLVLDLPRSLIPVAGLPVVDVNVRQEGVGFYLTYRFR